jgi:hypothetical protein
MRAPAQEVNKTYETILKVYEKTMTIMTPGV